MKISTNWIKEYVPLGKLDTNEVLNRITVKTAEVEEVEEIGAHLSHVVTARVVEVKTHPNEDKLKLVRVNDGLGEMEVVCGAPNVAVDQVVALAKAGTELPGGKLEATKIRGVRSEGMICAEDELGLSDDHEGIMVFPNDTEIGITLDKIFGGKDIVLDIDNKSLTHRPDLWGHVGFAREFAAAYEKPFKWLVDDSDLLSAKKSDPLRIDNQIPELCPRYSALVVHNVEVKPSPTWMQQRLRAVGLRPINNLVDLTNYIMLELGQPMHAFDRRYIDGDVIIIRAAEEGEAFMTLDGNEHALDCETIVIADASKSVALGGVMGGENSQVVDDTTALVLESANFHPTSIRRTANRLNLRTDSAMRFEKGQDPENTWPSIARYVQLLKLTCPDATVASEFLDSYPNPADPVEITVDFDLINRRLGERLPEETIIDILKSLQFGVERLTVDTIKIKVPSYRAHDVTMAADIVEEIGRIYGYDNITPMAPLVLSDPPEPNLVRKREWKIRDVLAARLGFDEVVNYSFTCAAEMEKCGLDPEPCLRLKNPLSSEADRMRTSLIPHIVSNLAINQKNYEVFRLFELGRTTIKANRSNQNLAQENRRLAGAVFREDESAYFEAKGAVEELLKQFRIADVLIVPDPEPEPWAHPGRCAVVVARERALGKIAELHPKVADRFELRGKAALFDLDLDVVFDIPIRNAKFTPLRRFPVNPIEVTVVVDRRQPVADIEAVIKAAGGDHLVSFEYLYSYEGERLSGLKKAITYHVVFGADDRTLGHEEVAGLHEGLVSALRNAGMPLRGEE